MDFVTWEEVRRIHRTQAGVGVKDGKITSLLISGTGDDFYSNRVDQDEVTYHIRAAGIGVHWISLIQEAKDQALTIIIFRKIVRNRWQQLGNYQVHEVKQSPNEAFITLRPIGLKSKSAGDW